MSKEIQIPGLPDILSFPDTMSDDDIKSVIKRKFFSTPQITGPERSSLQGSPRLPIGAFGHVPIPEETELPIEQRAAITEAQQRGELESEEPLTNVLPELTEERAIQLGQLGLPLSPRTRGRYEGVREAVNSLGTLRNAQAAILTGGIGALPGALGKVGLRLAGAGFAASMAPQAGEAAGELSVELAKPEAERDEEKIGLLESRLATTGGMMALAGAGAAKPIETPLRTAGLELSKEIARTELPETLAQPLTEYSPYAIYRPPETLFQSLRPLAREGARQVPEPSRLEEAGARGEQPASETARPEVQGTAEIPEEVIEKPAEVQPVPQTAPETKPEVLPAVPREENAQVPSETSVVAVEKPVAKAQQEVSKVAAVEEQRPAKEVKSELISKIEKAIEDAPSVSPEVTALQQQLDSVLKGPKSLRAKRIGKELQGKVDAELQKSGKITIEIPGDGTFTVFNTKPHLSELLSRAKRLDTSATRPIEYRESKPTRAQGQQWMKEASVSTPIESIQGAISMPGAPLAPLPPVPSLTPKSQRVIIADLAKGLGVPIRFGRLRTSKFAGYFLPRSNLVGSKLANNIPVVSHEVGHKLDQHFDIASNPALVAELNALGDPATPNSMSSWTPSKTASYRLGEGVGEFIRYWLTDTPHAASVAPNTLRHFEALLDANKDFGDVMRQARDDIRTWRTAEPQARLRSHISVGENPNKTRYTLSQLTRDLVDDLHIVRLAVDDAQRMGGPLNPSDNPYLLARNLRGSYGMADTFIRQGIADFKTKAVTLGTSLEDALRPVAGRINDFRDWIVAKRAQELHSQNKNTGLVPNDVNQVAARFDADPSFQDAFTKVKVWQDAVLKYAEDSGLITADDRAATQRLNADYVPFHRVFEVGAGEAPAVEGGGSGRGLNVGKPASLRGLKGSPRDIVDPLETMIKNAYSIITASEKAAINQAVAGLAGKPGMGKWVEHIKAPMESVRVGLAKVREQLENAGADLTQVPDDLLLSFWRGSGRAPFGENVIRIVQNGKPEFYRLNKDLFDTFHALDLDDTGSLIRLFAAGPAQLLRAGVTLDPSFSLANALRDTFSSAVISKYGVLPFETTIKGFAAMINNPKLVAEWAASGGKNAVEASYFDRAKLQKFLKEKITKDLTPAEQATIVAKSPLTALRWLTSISEEATRIGEYQTAFKKLTESGMPEGEARRLAAFESRDRQDFAKGGAKTKIIRHIAAFWNAGLQANVKLAQSFKERPIRTTLQGIAYITTAKLLEQYLNWDNKDYWDRPQWERDLFFLIPAGKATDGHTRFVRIPTPFEVGLIFGTLPGRISQYAHDHDPSALTGYFGELAKQTVPNPIPQSMQVLFSDFLSGKKGWDIWRGRTVVPESLSELPPDMQWTEQTSLTAKKLGQVLGYSPMKIDHIIAGTTGGLGRQLTHQIVDRAIEAFSSEKRTAKGQVPGGRFVTTPATVSSQAMEDFYQTLTELKTEQARVKSGGGQPRLPLQWIGPFTDVQRLLGDLRKASREGTEEEKTERREFMLQLVRQTMNEYRASLKQP